MPLSLYVSVSRLSWFNKLTCSTVCVPVFSKKCKILKKY